MSQTEVIISADKLRMITHGALVGAGFMLSVVLSLSSVWALLAVCILFGALLLVWLPDYIRLWQHPVIGHIRPEGILYQGVFLPSRYIDRWERYGTRQEFGVLVYLKDTQDFLAQSQQSQRQLLELINLDQTHPHLAISLSLAKQSPKQVMRIMQEWYGETVRPSHTG